MKSRVRRPAPLQRTMRIALAMLLVVFQPLGAAMDFRFFDVAPDGRLTLKFVKLEGASFSQEVSRFALVL